MPVSVDISGQLIFLGTGTSHGVPVIGCGCATCASTDPHNKRLRCSIVVGCPHGNLLIDTTPDLRTQLLREGIGMIDAVAYTHAHADHLFGLDDLRIFPLYSGKPMPIYCEANVEKRIRTSFDYCFQDSYSQYSIPQLEFRPLSLQPFEILGQTVQPIRLRHGRLDVLGFRFGNVAYCTDTSAIPEESWPLLAGLDVLILDCLRPEPHPTHFNVEQAVAAAERIGAKRTLFTHIACRLEHAATNAMLPAGMELAFDRLRIALQ